MIDLVQYRYRIGSFRPGHCSKNSFKRFIFSYEFSLKESQNCMNTIELMLRKKLSQSLYLCSFLLVLVLLILAGVLFIIRYEGCQSLFNPINLWLPFNRVKHNIYMLATFGLDMSMETVKVVPKELEVFILILEVSEIYVMKLKI